MTPCHLQDRTVIIERVPERNGMLQQVVLTRGLGPIHIPPAEWEPTYMANTVVILVTFVVLLFVLTVFLASHHSDKSSIVVPFPLLFDHMLDNCVHQIVPNPVYLFYHHTVMSKVCSKVGLSTPSCSLCAEGQASQGHTTYPRVRNTIPLWSGRPSKIK